MVSKKFIFHIQTKEEDDTQLTKGMVKVVRKTGQLNLAGRSLAAVPERMFKMYDLDEQEANVHYDLSKCSDDPWWSFKPLTYLDLSSNVITNIPGDIKTFEELVVLNFQDNNLKTLPNEIGALTKLTKLNLSHNKISSLPNDFYKLTELQYLNLSHNKLETMTADIGDLVMLQKLDLSHNLITNLPSGMGFVVRLTDVNLSYNKLTELPPDILNLRALRKLDVTQNDLKSLPKLGELRKLQFLYAQHNDIVELPDFEGCEHIEQVYFGNNFIKDIPKEFCESAVNLKILDVRDNQIESLPDEIAMLQQIIRLDLSNNAITKLPNSMGLLAHLQNLQIEGNLLKNIRQDLIKGGTIRILKYLRDKFSEDDTIILKSDNRPLPPKQNFPDKYIMKNTRSLCLPMKDLSNIPPMVFEDALWADVCVVDLSNNKLAQIPAGLQVIASNLKELNLSKNLIKSLPDFLSECVKLQYLNLANNDLTTLPESLHLLPHLQEIVLTSNRFSRLPSCVYGMENLEILLSSDNQITAIDVNELKRLKRLATLDLTNNSIQEVPPQLGNMKQLRHLELKGNSFRQPRYAILEQGTESILAYLRDRIPQ